MSSPVLARIHRYVALSLGVVAAVITAAGALLVFRDELTPVFTPSIVIAPGAPAGNAYQRMLDIARSAEPRLRALQIVPDPRADRAWEDIIDAPAGERHVFVDPHDGRIVADSTRDAMPFAVLFRLHTQLLSGSRGEVAVGIAGSAALFLAVSGVVLWWPRSWRNALRVRWNGNRLAVSYDLHRCAGAFFALFVATNALIGVSMVFSPAFSHVVNRIAGRAELTPAPPAHDGAWLALDALVARADREFPQGYVSRIHVVPGAPVGVRKIAPGDQATQGMNRIDVDPVTGEVVRVRRLAMLPPGDAMYEWSYPLHTGKLVGRPYRALLVLVGLVPLFSLTTGLIMWRSKGRKKKRFSGSAGALRTVPMGASRDQAGS